jgi:UDP-N-acetylglucosamine 2-epimerase (non-hydrolysing)
MIQYVLNKENIEISYQNKVFITAHRRENIGVPLQQIATAILELATENPEIEFHWALHPNPNTRKLILEIFNNKPENVIFTEPLNYTEAIKKWQHLDFLFQILAAYKKKLLVYKKEYLF